jgi:site-specific DNA-methyltransferase (adenine-specific)
MPAGRWPANLIHDGSEEVTDLFPGEGEGSAARFFYCAKANKADRGEGNDHPTVKPSALMQYLCRLVCPPGGVVLDPFAGSGSTLLAARALGMRAIGIEREEKYCRLIAQRLGGVPPAVRPEDF